MNPDPPTSRSIVSEHGVVVVPWTSGLTFARWAIERRPEHERLLNTIRSGRQPAIFELWETGESVVARPHLAPAPAATAALARWGNDHGKALTIGPPLPDYGEPRELLDLPQRAGRVPDFEFLAAAGDVLRIAPWGFTDLGITQLEAGFDGAVGYVHVTAGEARAVVAYRGGIDEDTLSLSLARWARNDGVQLVSMEHGPMLQPQPAPECHPGCGVCDVCGDDWGTGMATKMGFSQRGWMPTRCPTCGTGRVRWWGRQPASHRAADPRE